MTKGVIIVTGSTRGIGKEVAKQLLQLDYAVVINGRDVRRLDLTRAQLEGISHHLLAVESDVSTSQGAKHLIDATMQRFGRIDGLVNNVGVSSRGNLGALHPEVIQTVFQSNVYGAIYPTQQALPYVRQRKGSIIFVSSLAGIRGLPGLSPYCASKMALSAFVDSLRIEEHGSGVHFGIVLVGKTEVEADKEVITESGQKRLLAARKGKGIQAIPEVAKGIVKALLRRRYKITMTRIGKIQSLLQAISPRLVERIIIKNAHRFEEENK